MAVVRKKQDDKILKTLREFVTTGGNKECFDCGQKGPTYVNMTIGSFVCTSCSGVLRGLTPPHRVKSISMATFTQDEIEFLRQHGNEDCSKTWLGLWDAKRAIKQDHRDFMVDKYERKRYYLEPASPLKSLPTSTTSSSLTSKNGLSSSSTTSLSSTDNIATLKTITLTPPTSLRLNKNSNNHTTTNSSTNIKFQQQFTPDDNSLFHDTPKLQPPLPQKHHPNRLNGVVTNGLTSSHTLNAQNGLTNGFNSSNNNPLNSNNNNNNVIDVNKFTPDTDFIADFSKVNIINSVNNKNNSLISSNNNNNSNVKLSNGLTNGLDTANSSHSTSNGDFENFADFDHNPIYNAAGLPMSLSSTSNSLNSSGGTYNSNQSINSTPPEDRYAALKDLDEQFREVKFEKHIEAVATNGHNGGVSAPTTTTPTTTVFNPFKTANPFQNQQQPQPQQQPQQQQQQQQTQQSTLNWPSDQTTTNGFYASSPYQNGFGSHFQNGFATQFNSQPPPPTTNFNHHNFGNPFMAAGAANSNNPFL